MIPVAAHRRRRTALQATLRRPVLLLGNGVRARNLPMTALPFRQDSTLLYFIGCELPGVAALIDCDVTTLFAPLPSADDALWHGPTDGPEALRDGLGVDQIRPTSELHDAVRALMKAGRRPAVLAVADEARNALGTSLTGTPLAFGTEHGDPDLVAATIAMRRTKDADELAAMRMAAAHTRDAHLAVARALHPGGHERTLAALFEAVLAARGCSPGYATILSRRGEILHNHRHDAELRAGALLLVDGGGEVASGHGSDVTRTWPVGGVFVGRQRAAYEAVLAAESAAIARCRPGVRYREVHDVASLEIARFLADEGLLRVSPEDAVAEGAHALFFPHGVGHHLGMDVHDLENFGDLPSYPAGVGRPEAFGTCYLRLDLPLEPGWVVTVEPGFYVVPAILSDAKLRDRFAQMVDFNRAADWLGFGGIRIEDDVVVTGGSPENLTADIPRTIADIEAVVGSGSSAEDLLGGLA